MGQINTNNYPTVDSLADADLLIVENAIHGTGTTTPKQLRENAIGTDALKTTAQTVTGAINEVWETAGALRGSGKVTSGSSSTIDTDIDLGRAPQVGDRILLLVDSKITAPISVTTYNGSTAITTYWGMLDPSLYLNGVCILEFEQGLEPDTCTVKLVKIFEGTIYTEGTGISLNGDKITNTKPQWGDNIVGQSLSSVSSGNLGIYEAHSGYLIITFDCNAQPASDGYWLSLQDNSGSVVIMKAAVLVDPVTGGRYSRNIKKYTTLICEVTNSGSGSSSDPILVNVIGEITNDLADKVDAVLDAISEEKTVSGNPIVITDALPVPAKSLETTINAIQDLHGYDKPWAGGAGKNKLADNLYSDGSSNNITWKKNDDGSITVTASQTVTTSTKIDIGSATLEAGTYVLTGINSTKSYIDIRVRIESTSGSQIAACNSQNQSVTFTLAETTTLYFVFIVLANYTEGSITTYPMIRLASETDPTFAPYSNICPISGRTAVVVNDHGLNMFNNTAPSADTESSGVTFGKCVNGTIPISGTATGYAHIALSDFPCRSWWGNVTLSGFDEAVNITIDAVRVKDANDVVLDTLVGTSKTMTINLANYPTVAKLTIDIKRASNGACSGVAKPIIVAGTTAATAYVPFTGNADFTIQLGTTVYGGDINWDTGVTSITWAKETGTASNINMRTGGFRFYYNPTAIGDRLTPRGIISDKIPTATAAQLVDYATAHEWFCYLHTDSGGINFNTVKEYANVAELIADVGEIDFIYKLATPTTIQLTPTQLEMLKGYNRVSIEDGTITLTYLANKLDALLALMQTT